MLVERGIFFIFKQLLEGFKPSKSLIINVLCRFDYMAK